MLSYRATDSEALRIDIQISPPTVYLDTNIISILANSRQLDGESFRDTLLNAEGTLYLSWAHLLELLSLGTGPTFDNIRSYLASFGPDFIIIDSHIQAVIDRENAWRPGRQNPVIDEDFLKILGENWDGKSNFNFGMLLDIMTSDPAMKAQYQQMHREHKEGIKQAFDDGRQKYQNDAQMRRRLDAVVYQYAPPEPPTRYINDQMRRECIRTQENFELSDGLDFEHFVVSVSYCDYVMVDNKWAHRASKITIPHKTNVYRIRELDQLKADIERIRRIKLAASASN